MLQKKMTVIGLMSGTSADGITAAIVSISGPSLKILHFKTFPFKKSMREKILNAATLSLSEISRLNAEIGILFAQAAQKISQRQTIDLIGSHGQTIWHGPRDSPPNTFQIGEPAFIAEKMKCPVIADFRPQDIASGGQGAPLIAAFDQFLHGQGPLRAVLNIGGIANVSFVGENKLWSSFDTGPGNCLMDLAVEILTAGKKSIDYNGHLASQGNVDFNQVKKWLKISYFKKFPPKSLDRNEFGRKFLHEHFGRLSSKELPNLLATLADLTALSIAQSIQKFAPKKVSEIVVSGGGALNPFLMKRLSQALSPIPVLSSESLGMPVMAKEAACFAWLAYRAFLRLPNNCPEATGARGPRILGKIIHPPL